MSQNFIEVDSGKCVRCGFCIIDCPTCVLEMGDNGPQVREDQCIECGHCVAVCPTEALDNTRTPRAEQKPFDPAELPTPEQAACFLRTRRSIRGFLDKPVPRETIDKLLDIARIAPTGGNTQGVRFHIIHNKERLREITAAAMAWAEQRLDLAPHLASMVAYHRATGKDNVLRNAPYLILTLMDEADVPPERPLHADLCRTLRADARARQLLGRLGGSRRDLRRSADARASRATEGEGRHRGDRGRHSALPPQAHPDPASARSDLGGVKWRWRKPISANRPTGC